MQFSPYVSTVAQTIQTALAPVFLLTGIAAIINVLTGRLARVVDRARALEKLHPLAAGPEQERHRWELALLDRRMSVINAALFLCVTSAMAICVVVAGLFVAEVADLRIGRWVAVTFIVAMVLLMLGLALFLLEVRLSLRATHIRSKLIAGDQG